MALLRRFYHFEPGHLTFDAFCSYLRQIGKVQKFENGQDPLETKPQNLEDWVNAVKENPQAAQEISESLRPSREEVQKIGKEFGLLGIKEAKPKEKKKITQEDIQKAIANSSLMCKG